MCMCYNYSLHKYFEKMNNFNFLTAYSCWHMNTLYGKAVSVHCVDASMCFQAIIILYIYIYIYIYIGIVVTCTCVTGHCKLIGFLIFRP